MESPAAPPVHPERLDRMAGPWASLFGEHARNAIAGWSNAAFDQWHTRRRLAGLVVHIPRHPDAVQRVLLDNAANYAKPRIVRKLIAPLVGRGLLSAEGELWRTQRKIVAPSFAPGAVAALTGTMAQAARAAMTDWPDSGTIDIARTATDTTMRIIAEALFSGDPRLVTPQATKHIAAALEAAGSVRLTAILGLPTLRLNHVARAGARGQRYLRETLTAIVRERGPEGGEDFLGGMIRDLHQRYPGGEAVALAIDNAATFYLAGHETTANALCWASYLMAGAPGVQERAREEARAALTGDAATLPERLPYLRQILDEALRLYPPAPRFDREALGDDVLAGETVRAGEIVSIWPWLIHRHRRLWENADAFNPERFAPGSEKTRHRFQFLPFGAGPRICVGARFATVEALVILAHWLSERRFALVPGEVPDPVGQVTLRPRGGLRLQLSTVD
ncbi:cytochrome P450 [Stakelama pacifica]|uniref:Cytochrome P450 n=1 Tax=Stakelama pacifica TaxID=517720 RepID=A0A4V3BU10_9SPHN|nr:cytochrome P450 [Stakelama pacifica]MAW98635.1 cytochrome P450 [Sphingomonas sp.]TDN85548.1 cytochrome P450 [Stakelama pacifica]GGO92322.1 cytochrome P450 [Stakelama pacifica]